MQALSALLPSLRIPNPFNPPSPPPRSLYTCGPSYPYNPTLRTIFNDEGAEIRAWPSPGGVIILSPADAIDLDFLSLSPLDPPLHRLPSQSAEDAFCQRLLLLGAKWWDSEARYSVVSAIEAAATGGRVEHRGVDGAFSLASAPQPTMREKRLVMVAHTSGPTRLSHPTHPSDPPHPTNASGVWISEFDTTWAGVDEEDDLLPYDEDVGRVRMCRTMEERGSILKTRFKAKFYTYEELREEYKGYGFFNVWEERERTGEGEVGKLLTPEETRRVWVKGYFRAPGNDEDGGERG